MNHLSHALRAEREFWDSIRDELPPSTPLRSLGAARAIQHRLDASVHLLLPVGQTRELMPCEVTPDERAALFGGTPWADTLALELQP